MAGEWGKAAAEAIHGGQRNGSGRKKKYVQVTVEEDLWLTLDSLAATRGETLDGAASSIVNAELKVLRGKAAIAASQQYFDDQKNQRVTLPETARPKFSLRKRHNYPLPKKIGEVGEPIVR